MTMPIQFTYGNEPAFVGAGLSKREWMATSIIRDISSSDELSPGEMAAYAVEITDALIIELCKTSGLSAKATYDLEPLMGKPVNAEGKP